MLTIPFITGGCSSELKTIEANLAFKAEATTGEGSIWHPDRNTLFWVDIEGKTLYEFYPDKQDCKTWEFDRMVSTVVPETDSTVIVSLQDEIVRVNLNDSSLTPVAPIPDQEGRVRCNDGKCDPAGRLWIGTMGFGAPEGAGTLYTVVPDGTVTTKLNKVTISNGIVWSANKSICTTTIRQQEGWPVTDMMKRRLRYSLTGLLFSWGPVQGLPMA